MVIVAALVLIGWLTWDQGVRTEGVATKTYLGFVQSEDREIPEEVRAQWEIQRDADLAILQQDPDDLNALQGVAVLERSLGNYATARNYIERYLELNSINPAGWTILGDIAWSMEDYKTAESSYVKSMSLSLNESTVTKLERLWREQFPDRYEDIELLYEDAIRVDGQRASYASRLARWYAEQERWQEAADNMNIVVQLNPDDQNAREEYQEYLQNAREQ